MLDDVFEIVLDFLLFFIPDRGNKRVAQIVVVILVILLIALIAFIYFVNKAHA